MGIKSVLFCSLCVAGMSVSSSTAMAGGFSGFSGTFSGDYGNSDFSNMGPTIDGWGLDGAGKISTNLWDMQLQADAGYHHYSTSGLNLDSWNLGGTAFWLPGHGRLGLTLDYTSTTNGSTVDYTNYGGFGEWWPDDCWTLSGKFGGFSGSFNQDGYYLGGSVTGYLHKNFRVTGAIDYADVNSSFNETDYDISAEWLVSERLPISIGAGYTYTEFSNTNLHVDTWHLALTWYYDEEGVDTSLVGRQRENPVTWTARFRPVFTKF